MIFLLKYLDFNPLRREGGDEICALDSDDIHDFNPLRREGGDHCFCHVLCRALYFNPLRREGGDEITGEIYTTK